MIIATYIHSESMKVQIAVYLDGECDLFIKEALNYIPEEYGGTIATESQLTEFYALLNGNEEYIDLWKKDGHQVTIAGKRI